MIKETHEWGLKKKTSPPHFRFMLCFSHFRMRLFTSLMQSSSSLILQKTQQGVNTMTSNKQKGRKLYWNEQSWEFLSIGAYSDDHLTYYPMPSWFIDQNVIMNTEKSQKILVHHEIPAGKHVIAWWMTFFFNVTIISNTAPMQLQHTWRSVMDCPLQSPDLNIIEGVWDHLYRQQKKREPTSKGQCWYIAWRTIPKDNLKKLPESLSKKVQTVLKNDGSHDKDLLSSLLELCKLLMSYLLYFQVWLHIFTSILEKYEQIRGDSGLLPNTV